MAFVPPIPGIMLDLSASGDAEWFAGLGWDVIVCRRPAGLACKPGISVVPDTLPALASVRRLALAFDLVWVDDALDQIAPPQRCQAVRNLAGLLKPGGRLILRSAQGEPGLAELERLGREFGLALRLAAHGEVIVVLELVDDGGGSLPLLRGLILNQEKSATYKLALLRCVARIADATPNVAREAAGYVELPLGLVALNWIRMFKPLVARGLPQRPGAAMGFASGAFHALAPLAAGDLRLGLELPEGEALRRALAHAARLIAQMPATHLTFADGRPVFPTEYGRMPQRRVGFAVDLETMWVYGSLRVPWAVWQTLRRMAAWIEPMLVAEWVRLTVGYAARQGRLVGDGEVTEALRWTEPGRDTGFARAVALRRMVEGHGVRCVWSGQALRGQSVDIDHCLPWSAWPCGDLWNLLPAAPAVNRHRKGERIVTGAALLAAKPLIVEWWRLAYMESRAVVRRRFLEEARASLPVAVGGEPDVGELFLALDFRRLRLVQETQLGQWGGVGGAEG